MCWVELVLYLLLLLFLVQLIRLILADADLHLLWKARYGKKPDVLQGQVVWITGASSGIGEHLAYDLARVGCKLILSARRKAELERVKKQCLVCGPVKEEDVLVLPLDMLETDKHKDAVKTVINKFRQIDILVNNAGRSQRSWAIETPLPVHKEMFELNVFSVMSITLEVLPHMMERKQGHIVNTSSIAGKMSAPVSATYSATKHALQGWFDTLRIELSEHNIAVTNICPGPVLSDVVKNSFTEQEGQSFGKTKVAVEKRMSTERCTELMTVAIANRLYESWISLNPVLTFAYASQYAPDLYKWIGQMIGLKVVRRIRHN